MVRGDALNLTAAQPMSSYKALMRTTMLLPTGPSQAAVCPVDRQIAGIVSIHIAITAISVEVQPG